MKKVLLGTSALVGASMLAGGANAMPIQSFDDGGEPILTASIVMQFEAGIADNDDLRNAGVFPAGRRDGRFVSGRFAEIWFQGEMTADNGLTYGARISLAADTPTRTNTYPGRKYIYFSGGWGSLEMGDWIGATSTLSSTPIIKEVAGNGTFDHAFGEYFVVPGLGSQGYRFVNWAGWFEFGTKITYYTPVFAGFQAGISYSPTTDNQGNSLSNRGGIAGIGGTGPALTNNGGFKDAIGVGVKWEGDLGPVGVRVTWAGLFSDPDTAFACGGAVNCANIPGTAIGANPQREGQNTWELGGQLTYGGFALTMAYFDDNDTGSLVGSNSDTTGFGGTLNYTFGPAIVGVVYYDTEMEANDMDGVLGGATQSADFQGYGFTAGYTIATGLKWYADVMHADFNGPNAGQSAEGWTGYTGVYVSF